MERTFSISECCLSCDNRAERIGKKVTCKMDGKNYPERLVCNRYKKTTNNRILGAEVKLIPSGVKKSKVLIDWLNANGLIKHG